MPPLPLLDTAIVGSGSRGIYLDKGAPFTNINPSYPTICVGTATGQFQQSSTACTFALPQLPTAASKGHILPVFTHSLVGVGTLCDAKCTIVFTKSSATMFDPQDKAVLTSWRERTGTKLWRFYIRPQHQPVSPTGASMASLKAFSSYDLLSVEDIFCYLHTVSGFPVRSTCLASIKANNYSLLPGLTYQNASKYFPLSTETLRDYMKQTWKGLRSTTFPRTNPKTAPAPPVPPTNPSVSPDN